MTNTLRANDDFSRRKNILQLDVESSIRAKVDQATTDYSMDLCKGRFPLMHMPRSILHFVSWPRHSMSSGMISSRLALVAERTKALLRLRNGSRGKIDSNWKRNQRDWKVREGSRDQKKKLGIDIRNLCGTGRCEAAYEPLLPPSFRKLARAIYCIRAMPPLEVKQAPRRVELGF